MIVKVIAHIQINAKKKYYKIKKITKPKNHNYNGELASVDKLDKLLQNDNFYLLFQIYDVREKWNNFLQSELKKN